MLLYVQDVEPWDQDPDGSCGANPREVELLTIGVVSVSWRSLSDRRTHPHCHLHVGVGKKPPVDLVFDQFSGKLTEAQVVLQDEAVPTHEVFSGGQRLPIERGLPIIDVTAWRGPEYILEHTYDPVIGWQPLGTLAVLTAYTGGLPSRELDLGNLRLVLDASNLVMGFRIPDLDQDQIATVRLADTGE